MKRFVFILFCFLFCGAAYAEVISKKVEYAHGNVTLEGYLAYDETLSSLRPGVIVVHEWKGLNDYAKKRAEQLAHLGYVGFAIDMYGKGVRPESHEEAGKIAGMYKNDRNLMRERAKAALDFLQSQPNVNPDRIAAIGYCFGGTTVLEMARAGYPLKGVASFHGSLDTPVPAKKGEIKAKVAVFHGGSDAFVKPKDIEHLQKEMTQAEADWQMVTFGSAVHGFTVPSAGNDKGSGVAYDEAADRRSWSMLEYFLKEVFA